MKRLKALGSNLLKSCLFPIILLGCLQLLAQADSLTVKQDHSTIRPRSFNEENIGKYKNSEAFDYRVVEHEPTWYERAYAWAMQKLGNFLRWIFGNETGSGILIFIAELLPYLIGAVILFLFIKFFLKVNVRNIVDSKKNSAVVNFKEEEELIKNSDLNELINKALSQNNFRLAIRYYYLKILQQLSKRQIIDWQGQKTNADYLGEIDNAVLKKKFSDITYLYDFIWYGEFPIDSDGYAKAEKQFDETLKHIS